MIKYINAIKGYFKRLFDIFDDYNIFISSIVISLILAILDSLNKYRDLLAGIYIFLMSISLLVAILTIVVENKKIFSKNINQFDSNLLKCILIFMTYSIYFALFDYMRYKVIIVSLCLLVSIVLLIIRIICTSNEDKKQNDNIAELKDVLDKKVDLKQRNIYFREGPVNYDLFHNDNVINELIDVIEHCNPNRHFTIGLDGEWGSGKTTLINNVIDKLDKNKCTIINFDPWKYEDLDDTIRALLNEILKKIDFKMKYIDSNILIEAAINSVTESKNIWSNLIPFIKEQDAFLKINTIVNDYIDNSNKKLVIIIDNLDRIDIKNANFLIKFADTLVDFKNTIIILLYDSEILNVLLQEKFKTKNNYMDKLVNLNLNVPKIVTEDTDKILAKLIKNIVYDGKPVLGFLNESEIEFENLRDLKRYINWCIASYKRINTGLNIRDLTMLKYIEFKDKQLYDEIWKNKKYYIDGTISNDDIPSEGERKEYFNELFKRDNVKMNLSNLLKLFPNLDVYVNNFSEDTVPDGFKDKRIFSAEYFDQYFTDSDNDYTMVNKAIDVFADKKNTNGIDNLIKSIPKRYDAKLKFMERLEASIDKIDKKYYPSLIIGLYNKFKDEQIRFMPFSQDAYTRCTIIVAKLITRIPIKSFNKISDVFKEYESLDFLNRVKYYIQKLNGGQESMFNIFYDDFRKEILNKNIDMYDDKYYRKGALFLLFENEIGDISKERSYIRELIIKHGRYVYKLLNDNIVVSLSDKYGYSINKRRFDNMYPPEYICGLINSYPPKTKQEKFILRVYKKRSNDDFEKGVETTEEKNITFMNRGFK